MLRQILEPKTEEYKLRIPKEYINRKIEILVLPFDEPTCACIDGAQILQNTAGLLRNKKLDPVQWQSNLRSEWDNRP